MLAAGVSVLALGTSTVGVAQTIPGAVDASKTRPAPTPTPTTTATTKPLKPLYRNVRAFYRNVRAFWGDVNPFYRNVRAFWGDVDPFYRNVRAFWGDMDPATMATAAGSPTYSLVGPFWQGLGTQWEGIATSWQTAGDYNLLTAVRYRLIASQMSTLVSTSRSFWGAAVTKQTGKSFDAAFANPFLAKYGINLNDPASLAKLDASRQSQFFIEWYDGLMAFSGTDHADWWMKSVNWTPKLTQTMGAGAGSTLGLVDDYSAKTVSVVAKVDDLSKKAGSAGGHGEGVLSLIVSPHDGKGIMGIAPAAKVVAYNPFDATGSADWTTVSAGIQAVAAKGATVINLSLGEPGVTFSPEWRRIFTKSEINTHKDKTLYVIAAGNDGVSQSGIVNMAGALDTTFIVVGSVGPSGISEFSNRPGTVCLTDGGTECKASTSLKESGYLMNRFIVAPGELILVSDGAGGLVRQSGTSLAAPLVTGAVALIQDRWPWMREKPRDIAMVILGSAKDIGAPGIDPVYGVGMLDVEAAMSPLNFNNLKFYLNNTSGTSQSEVSVSTLKNRGLQSTWAFNNMYFTAFEKLDQVERDFLIPLSSRLYGQRRGGEYFQEFVYNRMVSWLSRPSFASGAVGFADGIQTGALPAGDGWNVQMSGRVLSGYAGDSTARRALLRSTVSLSAPSGGFGLSFGSGDGAVAVGGQPGFGLAADFDPRSGGVNPLLGFASGGAHAATQVAVLPGLQLRAGYTEQRRALGADLADMPTLIDRSALGGVPRYSARATAVGVEYQAAPWLRLSASATNLREPTAFLGVRPIVGDDLAGGTTSRGMTIGGHATLGSGVSLFGSATTATSRSAVNDSSLRIGAEGVSGTSFQAGIAKLGLLGKTDALRMTVAQPLSYDRGAIELTEMQVIDRDTGEKGLVTQRYAIGDAQARRLVIEGNYGASILDGRGQVSLFGRGELRALEAGTPRLMLGSHFQIAF
ncbi:S8 family serine peptidase [Sphingomonas radiodurans]|uniref:S8 family serine peptidase n=1 Tax=Sphingomonas radiodurans TaxID=2890321 RepID=UPI001E607291|nr:S8 family serine peptidase [Sphingomonas radiodurans]WBH18178.1 S8 family serine peptidase [Sphingomonas radiodurans]